MKTLVVGLGNPILTDDGVGVKVAYAVDEQLTAAQRHHITVTEASVGGLRLMELIVGYERVIIIDAIMHPQSQRNGHQPGQIYTMSLADLQAVSATQHSASAHDTSLVTALEMAEHMGLEIPQEVTIYAVEVENILEFNDQPTAAVAAVIPKVTEMVLNQL